MNGSGIINAEGWTEFVQERSTSNWHIHVYCNLVAQGGACCKLAYVGVQLGSNGWSAVAIGLIHTHLQLLRPPTVL